MNPVKLHAAIDALSSDLQKQVYDFVIFLQSQQGTTELREKRVLGLHRGSMHMREDFDDPLDMFSSSP